jgi:hypothetical protein
MHETQENSRGQFYVSTQCPWCGTKSWMNISSEGYFKWVNGELIQNALPELSPEEREMLNTGICGSCWDKL